MSREHSRILVVDDEPDTCANLSDILSDLGYQVDVAYDGPAALQLVEQHPYDVALLDLRMPGMDGLELYQRIKLLRSGTVAIVVTAYANSETADAVLSAGAWRIMAKPVDLASLLKHIEEVLDQPLVLVVDDDQDLCRNLWDILRERQYRVALAHDENEAQRQLAEAQFQVVLIDMRLPHADGGSVFRVVREVNPRARTVIITGHRAETERAVQDALSAGADAVCYKPFDIPALLETLKRLVRNERS